MRFFRGWAMYPRQRRIVQHNRNRGWGETPGLRDIPHRDGLIFSALSFHTRVGRLRGHDHHPSRVAHDAMGSSERTRHSGGTSNDKRFAEHRVFQMPNAMPRIIQTLPRIFGARSDSTRGPSANEKSQNRREEVRDLFSFSAARNEVVHESGRIYALNAISAPKFSNSMAPFLELQSERSQEDDHIR